MPYCSSILPLSCFIWAASEHRAIADENRRSSFVAQPRSALSGLKTSFTISLRVMTQKIAWGFTFVLCENQFEGR